MSANPNGEYFDPCGVRGGYALDGDGAYLEGSDAPGCLYLDCSKPAGLDLEWPWEFTMLEREEEG